MSAQHLGLLRARSQFVRSPAMPGCIGAGSVIRTVILQQVPQTSDGLDPRPVKVLPHVSPLGNQWPSAQPQKLASCALAETLYAAQQVLPRGPGLEHAFRAGESGGGTVRPPPVTQLCSSLMETRHTIFQKYRKCSMQCRCSGRVSSCATVRMSNNRL